jgi:hypothetical protein
MRTICVFALCVGGLAMAPAALGQFNDGFETYGLGTLPPQGGWTDFGGTQAVTVSNVQAHSGTKSMRLLEGAGGANNGYGSDVFKNFFPGGPATTGAYNLTYWQFMETGMDTVSFMYLTTGSLPTTFATGLDLRADPHGGSGVGAGMLVVQDTPNPTLQVPAISLVTGRWVEHSIDIDLGANTYTYRYDGVARVTNGTWDTTPGNGVALGGLNFWVQVGNANGTTQAVYFDDFSLTAIPSPASAALLVIPGVLGARRRRR